jgi:hypothetical protein
VHITTHEPTRRTAFKFGTAALIVGFGIPALASAATNPDAELIALCDRFTAVRNASISLDTIEDDADCEQALEALDDEWFALSERIYLHERPITLEGAKAMARAVIPHINKNNDRTFYGTMVQTSGNGWQFASPNFSRVAL